MCCCPEGFEGDRCDEDVDECASNPCNNGGTCTDFYLFYQCSCPEGSTFITITKSFNSCDRYVYTYKSNLVNALKVLIVCWFC